MVLALLNGTPGEIYNIGVDGPELTVPELIQKIEKICSVKVPLNIVEAGGVYAEEPMRRCPDIAKAKKHLGYNPLIALDDGLRLFFDWALENYTGINPTV